MPNQFELPSLKKAANRKKTEDSISYEDFNLLDEYKDLGKGKTFYIRTHGCQANERDSETMAGLLLKMGYSSVDTAAKADLIIVNTCAIRQNAEEKVFGELGSFLVYKRNNPDLIIAMAGCMSQEEKTVNKILRSYPQVDLIFGTHNIHRLPALLAQAYFSKERVVEVYSRQGEIIEKMPSLREQRHKASVNIMYGCDKFCTYCIVPYTRGKERSRKLTDIIAEIKDLKKQGYKEICLLGQNVNAYGLDLNMAHGFAQLLEESAKTGIERIRFMTPHPRNFDEETIDIIAGYENIMPQIHLPVQSGSSKILKKMNRSYDRELYLDLFDRLKAKNPKASFTTDIIVGFPNESDEDFNETLSLYDHCRFDNAYTFIFSPREGTPAASMDDSLNKEIKEERLQILNKKVGEYASIHNKEYFGRTVEVLCDGESKRNKNVYAGYTREGKLVNFTGSNVKIGDLVQVKITTCHSFSLNGEAL